MKEHFGVKAEEVKFLEVSSSNGLVRDADREAARGLFDKIELFFRILILAILGR